MHSKIVIGFALAFALGAAACSSDNGSSSSSSGTTSASTTTGTTGTTGTTTTGSTGTTTTGGSGGSSGTSGLTAVNGCDPATATDMTGHSTVTISYSSSAQGSTPAFSYSPACVKVSAGTSVTFQGATAADTFAVHPLTPGTNCVADTTNNPITAQSSGASTSFTFANAGTFPYFCAVHCSVGMKGAVYVQ